MKKLIVFLVSLLFIVLGTSSTMYAIERAYFPLFIWLVPYPGIRGDFDGDGDQEAGGGYQWKVADFKTYKEYYDNVFLKMFHDHMPADDEDLFPDYLAITMHLGDTTLPMEHEHPVKLCDTIARAGFDSFWMRIVWSANEWENYWFFKKDYTYQDSSGQVHDLNTDQDHYGTSDIEEAYIDWLDQAQLYGLKAQVDIPGFFMDNRTPYDDIFPRWVQRYYQYQYLPDADLPPFVISNRPYAYSPWIYFQDADDFSKNIGGNPDNPTINTPPSKDEWWYDDNQNRSWTCNWGGDVEYTIDVATEPSLWDGYALRYWTAMNQVWDHPACLGFRLVDEPFAWDFFDMAVQMRLTHDMSLYQDLDPPPIFIPQTWKKMAMIVLPTAPDGYGGEDWSDYPMTDLSAPEAGGMSIDNSKIENPYGYTGKDYYDWVVHCYLYPQTEHPSKEYKE